MSEEQIEAKQDHMNWGAKAFAEMELPPTILSGLSDMGYQRPTEVQDAVLQVALTDQDIIVQSHTGSGKTTAFALPTQCKVDADNKAPQAIILTPTRELANQVALETRKIGKNTKTNVLAIYGGASMQHQIKELNRGAQILVGTPGRVLDLIGRGALKTDAIKTAVLDEADEMLSMGFWEDVTKILRYLPQERQTMLFSATLPPTIELAAKSYLTEPQRIDLSSDTIKAKTVSHYVYEANPKYAHTRNFLLVLENHRPSNAIIFCNRKDDTQTLSKYLKRFGFKSAALNGDMSQTAREKVLANVRNGKLDFMVATDVAARGIDISDLPFVFHYDMPESNETYVHRSGRTGRIGKSGKSIALARGKFLTNVETLKKQYDIELTQLKLPSKEEMATMQAERITQILSESADGVELGAYRDVAKTMLEERDVSEIFAFLLRTYFNQKTSTNSEAHDAKVSEKQGADNSGNRRDKKRRDSRDKDRSAYTSEQDQSDPAAHMSGQESNAKVASDTKDGTTAETSTEPKQNIKKIGPVNLYVTLGQDDGIDNLGELMEVLSDLSGIDDVHFTGRGRVRSSSSHIEIDHDKSEAMIAAIHGKERPTQATTLIPQEAPAQDTEATANDAAETDAEQKADAATQDQQPQTLVCEVAKTKRRFNNNRRRQDNRSRGGRSRGRSGQNRG